MKVLKLEKHEYFKTTKNFQLPESTEPVTHRLGADSTYCSFFFRADVLALRLYNRRGASLFLGVVSHTLERLRCRRAIVDMRARRSTTASLAQPLSAAALPEPLLDRVPYLWLHRASMSAGVCCLSAVSYTHLTLPTIYSV